MVKVDNSGMVVVGLDDSGSGGRRRSIAVYLPLMCFNIFFNKKEKYGHVVSSEASD